jgi:putative RecB family exonuclease
MISEPYRTIFLKDRRRTVAIEDPFEVTLNEGSRYTGVIDRLAIGPDDTLHVIDYKTTSRPPTVHGPAQTLQIRSYGMGRMMKSEEERIRLSYEYLRNGTEFSEILDRPAADETAGVLEGRIAEVKQARSYPAKPSALCGWCGYRELCSESGYYEQPSSTRPSGKPVCPRCGGSLIERRGRYGEFLGCENFPECRYTRN